jgi:hypothetical protein
MGQGEYLTLPFCPSPSFCDLSSEGLEVMASAGGFANGSAMVALALPRMPPLSGWRWLYGFIVGL